MLVNYYLFVMSQKANDKGLNYDLMLVEDVSEVRNVAWKIQDKVRRVAARNDDDYKTD